MKPTIRIARLLFLSTLFLPLTACSTLSGKSIEGQVIEQGSNKPIQGAIVIVQWIGSVPSLADSHTVCVHVDTATTNINGTYHIPAWHARSQVGPIVLDLGPTVTAYKAGYRLANEYPVNSPRLVVFAGTPQARLQYLSRIAVSCSDKKEIEINLLPFYRALYEEAKTIAVTEDDQEITDNFLSKIETIELGYNAALQRAIERAERRKQQP